MHDTLPDLVRGAAARHGDRTAVVDAGRSLSFRDLHAAVATTARAWVALGVEPGDRVAVWAPNSLEWEVAALAASYAGGALVPLNTRYRGAEVADVLRRTGARLLVVDQGFLDRDQLGELAGGAREEAAAAGEPVDEADLVPGLPHLVAVVGVRGDAPGTTPWHDLDTLAEQVPAADVEARADAVSPDDVADVLFTSGTTGRSKGVLSAHAQTVAAARTWAERGQVGPDDRYLLVNPYFHSFGYKAGFVVALLTGCAAHPVPVFDADEVVRTVEREGITVLPGAPAVFTSLFASPALPPGGLPSLRLAVTGAATVPVALVERMQRELSIDVVLTAYGMTECVVATMCRPGDPDERVATTCGAPVDGLDLRIADPRTGAVLPVGAEGEVQLRGPMVMRGYLDDPAATAEAVVDGWLRTGDVGVLDDAGYLRITDRLKDVYICGGFNVYPAEVEQVLARHDAVAEAAVVGVPDARLGEVGKAFVVARPGTHLDPADVVAFARERVANFKVPRQVVLVDALPRNLAGKVLKNELRSTP